MSGGPGHAFPEHASFTTALDHLSTLAPHRVRAVPASIMAALDAPAPAAYQFRTRDDERWHDRVTAALVAIEAEHRLTSQVRQIKGRAAAVTVYAQGARPETGETRSHDNALIAHACALAAYLTAALVRQAR